MLEKWFDRLNRLWTVTLREPNNLTPSNSTYLTKKLDSLEYMGKESGSNSFGQLANGILWYPIHSQSIESIAGLIGRIEEVDDPPYRTTAEEIANWVSTQAPTTGIVGIASTGEHKGKIICYARVVMPSENECVGTVGIDPDFRSSELTRALVSWQMHAGRLLLDGHSHVGRRTITVNVSATQSQFQDQLRASGFIWRGSTHEMRRDLEELPAIPDLGNYVKIVPWASEWEESARRFYNKLTSGTGAYPRVSREQWDGVIEDFSPECSFVSLDVSGDRPQVNGLIMVGLYTSDWEVLGWREGYIEFLGVNQTNNVEDITKALIASSLQAQKAAGLQKSAASGGVDGTDRASLIYEEMGFKRAFEVRTYVLEL